MLSEETIKLIPLGGLDLTSMNRYSGYEQLLQYRFAASTTLRRIDINQIDITYTYNGSIDADEQIDVRSEIPGIVRSINFTEGSNVSKGQLLVKIDDRELKAQLQQALTLENQAGEIAKRSQKLLDAEAISKEENENLLAEYESLQAQTQLIRVQISKTEVRAPFRGKIGLRNVSVGSYLTPTAVISRLVSINPVKITFSLPEKYMGQVNTSSTIEFTVAGSQTKYTAKVYAVEPSIETNTRSLSLRARAANPNGKLLPGSFAKVRFPLSHIDGAILIPTEAVVPVQKGKQVFITKNGKAKAIDIQSDLRLDSVVLVTEGLKVGDTVLTSGLMAVKEGSPVKVNIKRGNVKGN
ncbi:MAG: efflux RND transporter periplasmic adaptor subunit [Pedobacter sp.]|nr:MAG: efflux RND transporter periplasmic adaptor subunit [Pedobacter sp.]